MALYALRLTINVILILLIIFTPIAFGSVELWAFSLIEFGILLIIILGTIQSLFYYSFDTKFLIPKFVRRILKPDIHNTHHERSNPSFHITHFKFPIILLFLFLILLLLQMTPLP